MDNYLAAYFNSNSNTFSNNILNLQKDKYIKFLKKREENKVRKRNKEIQLRKGIF